MEVDEEVLEPLVDSELFEIYQQEVQSHIAQIYQTLDSIDANELFDQTVIYRALHTINGASKTAGINTIGDFASIMESPLRPLMEYEQVGLNHHVQQLYIQGTAQLELMVNELEGAVDAPSFSTELYTEFEQLNIELPAGAEPKVEEKKSFLNDEPDDELIEIFLEEANEILNDSDAALFEWKNQIASGEDDDSVRSIMEVQRYLHTLKGGAKMADFKSISDLSHEMESLFIDVLDDYVEINIELMDLLNECYDLLANMVESAAKKQPMPECSKLIEAILTLRKKTVPESKIVKDLESIEDKPEETKSAQEEVLLETNSDDSNKSQDTIRVRSDLLDNLVNSAGEVSIYRSRMQEQVNTVNGNLGELNQTISRLKRQLRDLEAETDAQIRYSHKDSDVESEGYDPLEMDRYTKMQELSKSLSESVEDLNSLQGLMGDQLKDSETLLLQQSRINTDLQDGLIRSRMVRFSSLVSRLRRIVRQASNDIGKKAELIFIGEENEIDNKVLDRMLAPLEHLLRNSIAHGVENLQDRISRNKREIGTITVDVKREGADIVISVADDGSGVDIEKVRRRALDLGIIEELFNVPEQDLLQLILEPGFSTAESVSQISGRGVGLDVVVNEVKQLGGTLSIESEHGKGTRFICKLPFTLSVNQAILVGVGDESYAIPLINVEGISRVENSKLMPLYESGESLVYGGNEYELHYLAPLLDINKQLKFTDVDAKQPIILAKAGEVRVALQVDSIVGNREIVVKSLGKQLSQVKALSGASILGDGRIVFILNVAALVSHGINQ